MDAAVSGHAQAVLAEFGRTVGLDDPTFDADGHCVLGIDAVIVNLERDEEGGVLLLYSLIGRPVGNPAAVYAALLRAQYLGVESGGMTFGLRPGDDAVVMSRGLDLATLDVATFQSVLQAFVDTAEAWMARLPELDAASPVTERGAVLGGLRA
jgi:hypothetical protein